MKYFFTIAFIIINGASVSLIHNVGNEIPVGLMITLSSLYALVFFHLVSYKTLVSLYKKLWQHKNLYLQVIFIFLLMWLMSFIIPVYYSPALLMFFATAFPSVIGSYMLWRKKKDKSDLLFTLLLFLIITAFYVTLTNVYSWNEFAFLLIGTLIVGVTMYLYSHLSYQMNLLSFSASEILASRYILLFLIPFIWSATHGELTLIDDKVLWLTLALSLISLIIPIYCSQISIAKVGPNIHSIAMGFTPLMAFIFELVFAGDIRAIMVDGIFATLFALILTLSIIFKLYRKSINV
ncbi:hypothetical protein [Fastidiosibacter lacustris]|uniref:hypothetical protein n=1 Tax=Fastidiosibacter lacustris TaxID=2056695 RepID=UPI000E34BF81|nr:hypothetical protein [Fastidiosibacter lacustris]